MILHNLTVKDDKVCGFAQKTCGFAHFMVPPKIVFFVHYQ